MPGPEREVGQVLDLCVITPRGGLEVILQVVNGRPVIVPPPASPPAATPKPTP